MTEHTMFACLIQGDLQTTYDPDSLGFHYEGHLITNPRMSACGTYEVAPNNYGFVVLPPPTPAEPRRGRSMIKMLPGGDYLVLNSHDCLLRYRKDGEKLAYSYLKDVPTQGTTAQEKALSEQEQALTELLMDARWRLVNKNTSTEDYARLDKPVVDRIDEVLRKRGVVI